MDDTQPTEAEAAQVKELRAAIVKFVADRIPDEPSLAVVALIQSACIGISQLDGDRRETITWGVRTFIDTIEQLNGDCCRVSLAMEDV